jgi:hypothetical protein
MLGQRGRSSARFRHTASAVVSAGGTRSVPAEGGHPGAGWRWASRQHGDDDRAAAWCFPRLPAGAYTIVIDDGPARNGACPAPPGHFTFGAAPGTPEGERNKASGKRPVTVPPTIALFVFTRLGRRMRTGSKVRIFAVQRGVRCTARAIPAARCTLCRSK